jgi:hypothetical protein
MPPLPLSEDEFRLLTYLRAYADHRDQSLDPDWVREQLDLPLNRLQAAARGLAVRGFAEFFEWRPDDPKMVPSKYGDGPMPMDIRLTHKGWDSLRVEPEA